MSSGVGKLFLVAFLVMTLTLSSCSLVEQQSIEPGRTTLTELRATLGEPKRQKTSSIRTQSKFYEFSNGCSYQTEREKIATEDCPAVGEQSQLQYWLHQWEGKRYTKATLPIGAKLHIEWVRYSLIAEGLSVIYDPDLDRVVRVVKYVH